MNSIYAGIGSRSITNEQVQTIKQIAKSLSRFSYTLRSGGARGADMAFESQAVKSEIFVPWKAYNNNTSSLYPPSPEAIELSSKFHPVWDKLKDGVRLLMGRNAHIILGQDLISPVDFVVYCAPLDEFGEVTGGTGQGIRIAKHYNIPTYNIVIEKELEELRELYKKIEFNFIMDMMKYISLFYSADLSPKQLLVVDKYVQMRHEGKFDSFEDNVQLKRYFIDIMKRISLV